MYPYEKALTLDLFDESGVRLLHRQSISQGNICFNMHRHSHIELLRICEGAITVQTDSQKIFAVEGDVIIFPPHTPHSGFTESSSVVFSTVIFDIRNFYNQTATCKRLLEPLFDGSSELLMTTRALSVISALDALIDAKLQAAPSLSVVALTYSLLGELCTHCTVSRQKQSSCEMVNQALGYIEQNFSSELSVNMLCKAIGYSPTYFSQKFKEIVGMPPSTYIKLYRIEHGYRLISEGFTNIETVSEMCGFSDQNYFTRCFKAHFGHPPTFFC